MPTFFFVSPNDCKSNERIKFNMNEMECGIRFHISRATFLRGSEKPSIRVNIFAIGKLIFMLSHFQFASSLLAVTPPPPPHRAFVSLESQFRLLRNLR